MHITNDTMEKTTHELPLGTKIGRPPVEDGQSISSVAHRTLKGLQTPVSCFTTIERTQWRYTGGYNRRVSRDPQTSVNRWPTQQTSRSLTIYYRSQILHFPNMLKRGRLVGSQHTKNLFSQPVQNMRIIRKHCDSEGQGRRRLQYTVSLHSATKEEIIPTVSLPAIMILIVSSLMNLWSTAPSAPRATSRASRRTTRLPDEILQ